MFSVVKPIPTKNRRVLQEMSDLVVWEGLEAAELGGTFSDALLKLTNLWDKWKSNH